jgi:hypothetical protein
MCISAKISRWIYFTTLLPHAYYRHKQAIMKGKLVKPSQAVASLVKTLFYKLEGRGFDSQ